MSLCYAQTSFDAPGATAVLAATGDHPGVCTDCWSDSDRDGVTDHDDHCPGTETGAPVTMRGCPHDSDGDGLYDHRDRCANTAADTRVDVRGCAVGAEIPLPEVVFPKNTATLTRRAGRALDELVATLDKHTDLRVEIAGFTDSRGHTANNLKLSQRRAEVVRGYLLGAGIDAARVRARGYGDAEPVADNDTDWGRSRNRRVVVRILNP